MSEEKKGDGVYFRLPHAGGSDVRDRLKQGTTRGSCESQLREDRSSYIKDK